MKLGVRGKLFATSTLLVLVVVVASGLYLERALRASLVERVGAQLEHLARSGQVMMQASTEDDMPAIDALADELGAAAEVRVTVIGGDGTVRGDSERSVDEVRNLENHARRPEVRDAFAGGMGMATRYSTTVQSDLLYVAVPYERSGDVGVIRVAKPLADVEETLDRLRQVLLVAGMVAVGFAVILAAVASHWLSRTLRKLVDTAHAIAAGEAGRRVDIRSADELGGLAGSLNRMAEEIGDTVTALADERARLAAVLEGMGEALVAVDGDGVITLMNPAARRLLGVQDGLGRSLVELVRAPVLLDRFEDACEEPVEFEVQVAGRQRRLNARISQQDSGGHVLVMHDVTELRRLETIRRDFVANVSHELRTPVSIISANAETLLDGALEDAEHAPALVSAVHRNALRLSSIVNDLLDLSRIEAGKYAFDVHRCSTRESIGRAVEALAERASELEVSVSSEDAEDHGVMADGAALHQILVNFIENGVKYSGRGHAVTIRSHQAGARVRIEVADDGPGIEPRHRSRIFERFYRIDPGRSREMGGTGLGLAITRHLAENMGGRVGLTENRPTGSIFWVELPQA